MSDGELLKSHTLLEAQIERPWMPLGSTTVGLGLEEGSSGSSIGVAVGMTQGQMDGGVKAGLQKRQEAACRELLDRG